MDLEELIYKLEILVKIKDAISQTYNEISDSSNYHDCMELINDVEKKVIDLMKSV